MKIKKAVQRSIIIVIILFLSVVIGYIYSAIGHKSDLAGHPREYSEFVEKYASEYGIPEYIIYAVILEESNFQSNFLSDDGKIGLMQLSPETFNTLLTMTKESNDTGILYDPETNIKYGTYLLSYLYTGYNRWKTVFAAYLTDSDRVDYWMEYSENIDENGNLVNIPDKEIAEAVEKIEEELEMYKKLYY